MKKIAFLLLGLAMFVMPTFAQDTPSIANPIFITGAELNLEDSTLTITSPAGVLPAVVDGIPTYMDTALFLNGWGLVEGLVGTAELQFETPDVTVDEDGYIGLEHFTVSLTLSNPVVAIDGSEVTFDIEVGDIVPAFNSKNDKKAVPASVSDGNFTLTVDYSAEFAEQWQVGADAFWDQGRPTTTKPCNPKTSCKKGK